MSCLQVAAAQRLRAGEVSTSSVCVRFVKRGYRNGLCARTTFALIALKNAREFSLLLRRLDTCNRAETH
jgi:hypothetical protein